MLFAAAAGASAQGGGVGPPPNDDCANPQTVVGNGVFTFDTTNATLGPQGQRYQNCTDAGGAAGATFINHDVWFCWTATCTGAVTITTCGLTQVDTKIAFYAGCACPTDAVPPLCCNDDTNNTFCGRQSTITCEVVCGRQYMIQIGTKEVAAGGPGRFSIDCAGTPCPPPNPPVCDTCCGGKPRYTAAGYAAFTGTVAIETSSNYQVADPANDIVVTVFNIRNQATATVGCGWDPGPVPAFRYSDPRWTRAKLGTVFGLTLDGLGNVYVAHSSAYNTDTIGAIACGPADGAGSIYRLATGTGTPCVFANIPNNAGPGIGNIAYDCSHDQFFASNMDDGKIYRVSAAGVVQPAPFDHGVNGRPNHIPAYAPIADPVASVFTPKGRRVWAVQPHGGRLFYSVWNHDSSDLNGGSTEPNEVWSVGLDAAGAYIVNSARLEVALPSYGAQGQFSEPVSDISFNEDCKMLLAEKPMFGDSQPNAHDGRALEYVLAAGVWTLNQVYPVGRYSTNNNSAGGCDYDYGPGHRAWVSGDALTLGVCPDSNYGMTGAQQTGATPLNNIYIDYDGDTVSGGADKLTLGDVEIPCPCMTISRERILCDADPTTDSYTYTFTVTNNSPTTAYYVLLAPQGNSPISFSPNIIPINGGLATGQSTTVTTTVTTAHCDPNQDCLYCFTVFLVDQFVQTCCSEDRCISPPHCDCAQITREQITCQPGGTYLYTVTFQNLTAGPIEHVFLFPPAVPAGVTFNPNYFNFSAAPIPVGGSATVSTTINGAAPGSSFCFRMSLHNHMLMECCSFLQCVTVPAPCPGGVCAGPPLITAQPAGLTKYTGQFAVFSVGAVGTGTITYQWRKGGVNLADGPFVTGSTTPALSITNLALADAASYDVVVSNACGSPVSIPAVLTIRCAADWNGDGEVNGNDISDYINSWYADIVAGTVLADINQDGETNSNDISDYINAWYVAIINGGAC